MRDFNRDGKVNGKDYYLRDLLLSREPDDCEEVPVDPFAEEPEDEDDNLW